MGQRPLRLLIKRRVPRSIGNLQQLQQALLSALQPQLQLLSGVALQIEDAPRPGLFRKA